MTITAALKVGKFEPDYLDRFWLKLLAAGTYETDNGESATILPDRLDNIATAYNHASYTAPIIVGHTAINESPTYGTVDHLIVVGNFLLGMCRNLNEAIREGVRNGSYPRYQPRFFNPNHKDNPKPGIWFLQHVGFMGPPPKSIIGDLTTTAEFMESLGGTGRKLKPALRLGGPGGCEFLEFEMIPSSGEDIALLATALMESEKRAGRELNIAQAVQLITRVRNADR